MAETEREEQATVSEQATGTAVVEKRAVSSVAPSAAPSAAPSVAPSVAEAAESVTESLMELTVGSSDSPSVAPEWAERQRAVEPLAAKEQREQVKEPEREEVRALAERAGPWHGIRHHDDEGRLQ